MQAFNMLMKIIFPRKVHSTKDACNFALLPTQVKYITSLLAMDSFFVSFQMFLLSKLGIAVTTMETIIFIMLNFPVCI